MLGKNRKWWGLSALIPGVAMVFIDQSVLPVALPTIQNHFQTSNVALQWSVNSYLLVTAVLVLAGGKLGDRIGHRRTFCWGILLFALASALCGFSPNMLWLIGARALQGAGAALMFPASASLTASLFAPHERGFALGLNVSVSSLFLIIGPLLGGYFTEALSWRWIFWLNLPLSVLGLIAVLLFIPKSLPQKQGFDLWGFLFFCISSSTLITTIMQGREWGWASSKIIFLLLIFLVATFFLFWREKRAKNPFLDLSLFRHPIYKAVNISVFVVQFILMIAVFRAIFFQNLLTWSPIKTGVITVVSSLPVLFMSPVGGKLSDRFGPKLPIALGFLLLIYSFFWLAFFESASLGMLLCGLIAFGFGIPLIFTPSYASAMNAIPRTKTGVAFGMIATVRYLGGTLGVAAIGALIDHVELASLTAKNAETKILSPSLIEELISGTERASEISTLPNSSAILEWLKQARLDGFFYSHFVLGCLLILALAIVFLLYHRKASHQLPKTPAEGWD
ncbi:MAG: MFS transporter [Chlamydiales bacterium]|nr:MFS transporter [Chlamydiales bacterium]